MKDIAVTTEIKASPGKIWEILTEFDNYENWNPFIESIRGDFVQGKTVDIKVINPQGNKLPMKARIIRVSENREIRWRSKIIAPWLFSIEQFFILREEAADLTKFTHGMKFRGLLLSFFKDSIYRIKPVIEEMNSELKKKCENK